MADEKSDANPGRAGWPFDKKCRAGEIGKYLHFAACLVENPGDCPHAVPFGYGFLCRHPRWQQIVARTNLPV